MDGPVKRSSPEYQAVELHVGLKIRQLRVQLGLTQQQLAEMIGVTYQQAHKYEKGVNRISAGRLYEIAKVLGVDVGYFFQGLESGGALKLSGRQRLCLEVSRNFSNIEDERHQQAVSQLCRILATDL
jgi:transcriptional regulator with XRE-family HTH domain